jgi:hypothetical protein
MIHNREYEGQPMMRKIRIPKQPVSRRRFFRAASTVAIGLTASRAFARRGRRVRTRRRGPAVHTQRRTDKKPVVGSGDHRYQVEHDWAQLPEKYSWQTTHNVAVDRDNNLYVIHEGHRDKAEHPSIFVFDPAGRYMRSFGSQFQGGGHGLEVHQEEGEEFLYVTGYQHLKNFAKFNLYGEKIWEKRAPMESGLYAKDEDITTEGRWGRDRFMPTNFAFAPDGGFFLADGYGAYVIHRYDRDGEWQFAFGGPGKEDGQFQLPHGLWIDDRGTGEASLVVADRVNGRLQWFSLNGKHLQTRDGFILPANADVYGELLLVPDLSARITLLGRENKVLTQMGEDSDWRKAVLKDAMALRNQPDQWQDGKFLHPHDACFDREGNILVAEWVATGRITRLRRLT